MQRKWPPSGEDSLKRWTLRDRRGKLATALYIDVERVKQSRRRTALTVPA
jgi:hypothetical protein